MELATLSIAQARKGLLSKDFTAVELAEAALAKINERNDELNAYLEVFDDVIEQAREADRRLEREKETSPVLTGIPIAVKDNILIEGRKASAGSLMLEGYTATYDATVIRKLKESGAVLVGRTNMDEFAMGSSTENSAFGPTKNPHDTSRVAGGTSGGSAAAVASHMAIAALGSDTGGSVRCPASFCGVVGLKPTYGAVSRSGLIAAVSSFDQVGPLTHTVEDAEILFSVIRGKDPLDSTSMSGDTTPPSTSRKVVGVPRKFLAASSGDKDVMELFEATLERLKEKGYEIRDVELPSADISLQSYYVINFAEVSTNLARFDGMRYGMKSSGGTLLEDYRQSRAEGFGSETKRRIILGTYVLSAGYYDTYYGKAVAAREKLRGEFAQAFSSVDFIALPTMPMPAFKLGEKGDPLALYTADVCTVMPNLTGNPALSVPMGTVEREGKKLPVGIQFTAPHFGEDSLFGIGKEVVGER